MNRKIFLVLVFVIVLVVGLVSSNCTTQTPEVFELTYASMDSMEEPMVKVIVASWGEWLERESGGRIKLTILPSEQAAKASDIYDAVAQGIADIGDQYMGLVPGRFPLNEVTQLPLIFEYPAARQAGLATMELYEKYPELQEEFSDVQVLCFHYTNPAQVQNAIKPIHTMEDLEGMVMVELGTYAAKTMQALGGTPEDLPPPDIYDALVKGVVDGISCNYTAMMAFNFNEALKYSTIASLHNPGRVEIMNLDTFNSLPADLQKLFTGDNVWLKTNIYGHQADLDDQRCMEEFNAQLVAQGLPEIYVLPDEERARWVEAIASVEEEWIQKMEEKGLPGRAVLEDCRTLAAKYRYSGFCQECEDVLKEWGAYGH